VTCFVVPSKPAQEEINRRKAWWRENRPQAPDLFAQELERACLLLKGAPLAGAPYERDPRGTARKLLLPRTQHCVYYDYYPEKATVLILSVRSTARGRGPTLRRAK
jgi:hypothetical protein